MRKFVDWLNPIGAALIMFVAMECAAVVAVYAQEQKSNPSAQIASPAAIDEYEVVRCLGLRKVGDNLTLAFACVVDDPKQKHIEYVEPWRLNIDPFSPRSARRKTTLLTHNDRGEGVLLLPTCDGSDALGAALAWDEYLAQLKERCRFVSWEQENKVTTWFNNGVVVLTITCTPIEQELPAVGRGIVRRILVQLDDVAVAKVENQNNKNPHFVVEWGKAMLREVSSDTCEPGRHFEINTPCLTICVGNDKDQQYWWDKLAAWRKKSSPHIVLPPVDEAEKKK